MVGAEIPHFEMLWSAASTYVLGEFNSHASPKPGVVFPTQLINFSKSRICSIVFFVSTKDIKTTHFS